MAKAPLPPLVPPWHSEARYNKHLGRGTGHEAYRRLCRAGARRRSGRLRHRPQRGTVVATRKPVGFPRLLFHGVFCGLARCREADLTVASDAILLGKNCIAGSQEPARGPLVFSSHRRDDRKGIPNQGGLPCPIRVTPTRVRPIPCSTATIPAAACGDGLRVSRFSLSSPLW